MDVWVLVSVGEYVGDALVWQPLYRYFSNGSCVLGIIQYHFLLLFFYQIVYDTYHCKKKIRKIYGKKLAAVVAGILP